jgi:hypothetical protein
VEASPTAGESPLCEGMKKIKRFRLAIRIDQQEAQWARVEADNVAPVTARAILIRAPAGAMHVTFEPTRRDDGAWLPAHMQVRVDAKAMPMAKLRLEVETTYGNYRKFQAESRIVE